MCNHNHVKSKPICLALGSLPMMPMDSRLSVCLLSFCTKSYILSKIHFWQLLGQNAPQIKLKKLPTPMESNVPCTIGVKPKEKTTPNAFNVLTKSAESRRKIPARMSTANARDEIYNNIIDVRNIE